VSLHVILVGSRKDSQTYVRMKTKACEEVGIDGVQHTLPEDTTQDAVLDLIKKLNEDSNVNGILVQLPLPSHMDSEVVLKHLDPRKDVDGLHEVSQGLLFKFGDKAPLIPCTPSGCLLLLDHIGYNLSGKRAVVIGRSILVGKPMSFLLLSRDATVTVCHSKTADIANIVKEADVLIVAMGKANFVKGDWIKPGAVVIDVGINAVDDKTKKQGYRLVGDVDYEAAKKVASHITPVPGGVGPMTVAVLLKNTLKAYQLQNKDSTDGDRTSKRQRTE